MVCKCQLFVMLVTCTLHRWYRDLELRLYKPLDVPSPCHLWYKADIFNLNLWISTFRLNYPISDKARLWSELLYWLDVSTHLRNRHVGFFVFCSVAHKWEQGLAQRSQWHLYFGGKGGLNGCSKDQRVGRTGKQTEGAEGAKEVGEELRFSGGRKKKEQQERQGWAK